MILLIRHGQTEWNTEGRKQGRKNSPLTALGRQQTTALALRLQQQITSIQTPQVHISPLQRARESADIALGPLPHLETNIEGAIQEISYGQWEGLTNEEVDIRFPGMRKARNRDRWNYVIPDGESYAMLKRRVENWITGLSLTKNHIIITHDVVSRVIRGWYLGLDQEQILQLKHPHDVIFVLRNNQISAC